MDEPDVETMLQLDRHQSLFPVTGWGQIEGLIEGKNALKGSCKIREGRYYRSGLKWAFGFESVETKINTIQGSLQTRV